MTSLILRTASAYLHPLLLLFSVFLLLRGHDEPGGGFIGGLVAGTAFCLQVIAHDVSMARRLLHVEPRTVIVIGLACLLASGLAPMLFGLPFLTGQWAHVPVGEFFTLHLGTPLLFDIGVYLTVLGVVCVLVFSFAEEQVEAE